MRPSAALVLVVSAIVPLTRVAAGTESLAPQPPVIVSPRCTDQPLVLNAPVDYVLDRVDIRGAYDTAALTLTGQIESVSITRSRFGQILAGGKGQAAGMLAQGATVGSLIATDCEFYDAENQLLSTAEGAFGRVVFERCSFRVTESFLREAAQRNPWRGTPPVTEFANIDRLELIDVSFANTLVIIHPSVKQVILRGQIDEIHVIDSETQVIHLGPTQSAADVPGPTV